MDWIVEEMHAAGLQDAILVTSPSKDASFRGRYGERSGGISFEYVVQPSMAGLGDAVARVEEAVAGRDVLLALGDAVFEEPEAGGIVRRLLGAVGSIAIAVQQVPLDRTRRYGIVRPSGELSNGMFPIDGLVEKPDPAVAPGRHAVCARYRLPPSIFDALRRAPRIPGQELAVTGAIDALLNDGVSGAAFPLTHGEHRHDIGGFDTYFEAFLKFSLNDETYGAALRTSLGEALQ